MATRNTRTRIVALLSVMLAFAVMTSAAPAFAARSTVVGTPGSAASQDMGKFSLFVYDADSATKRPIVKASVVVSNGNIVLNGWTDANGRLSGMLKEGAYGVNVSANNFNSTTQKFVVKSGGTSNIEAALNKQVALGKLAVYAWEASALSEIPLAGATVVLYNSKGVAVAKGLTDKSGLYAVEISPDHYTLQISADGYQLTKAEALIKAGEATVLNVKVQK